MGTVHEGRTGGNEVVAASELHPESRYLGASAARVSLDASLTYSETRLIWGQLNIGQDFARPSDSGNSLLNLLGKRLLGRGQV